MNMEYKDNTFGPFFSPGSTEVNIIPVMSGEGPLKINEADLPPTLPVLALRNAVIFSSSSSCADIRSRSSVEARRAVRALSRSFRSWSD